MRASGLAVIVKDDPAFFNMRGDLESRGSQE